MKFRSIMHMMIRRIKERFCSRSRCLDDRLRNSLAICLYLDISGGKDPKGYYDSLTVIAYELKSVSESVYCLGGDCKRVQVSEKMLLWNHLCIQIMHSDCEQMFGDPIPKREIHAPLEPGYLSELDDSVLLTSIGIKIYLQMIGELRLAASLGRIDIIAAAIRNWQCSNQLQSRTIKFDTEIR